MSLKKLYPWLAGLSLAGIAILFSISLKTNEELHNHDLLEVAAERIKQRISAQISALYAVRGLYVGSDNVERSEFQEFAQAIGIYGRARGMQGLGFALATDPTDAERAKVVLKENYDLEREVWPSSDQQFLFPVVLLEPQGKRNRAALGYDMYSDAIRREAMNRAWAEDTAIASRPVTLVQEIDEDQQSGFLIYLPFYEKENANQDDDKLRQPTASKKKISGFVYAVFRAGDLMKTVLSEKPAVEVGIRAYSESVDLKNLLYANTDTISAPSLHKIDVAGKQWIFELEDHSSIQTWTFFRPSQTVLGLGLLLSLAFALFLKSQIRRAEVAEMISQSEHARAEEKDILLKEMTHRLKNAISRIVSVARMSAKGSESKDAYVEGLTGRLKAMAIAQELLANSENQRMNLRELIHKEFELIFGSSTGRVKVQGSDIPINEFQSQAIGLIVHELATNSTKYGAFAGDGGVEIQLRRIETKPKNFDVHISWIETGLEGTPDFSREGFGSRLIKMMVEGQLNGRLNKTVAPGRAQIAIQFPLSRT